MGSTRTSLIRRPINAVKHHPIVTGTLAIASIVWLGFGLLIGGLPFFGILWVAVVGAAWLALLLGRRRRSTAPPMSTRRAGLIVTGVTAGIALLLFGLVQLVPYGRPQTYAAGTGEPAWATPRTRELMVAACFDCHSNQVQYPWYSSIAPVSWTVQHHIDEGQDAVNYSNWATNPRKGDDTIEVIQEGSMPPSYFTAFGMHPEANLTSTEKAELIAGLKATPGFQGGGSEKDKGDR